MIKRITLMILIFASNWVLGKTYIENTQELRKHLHNKTIDKQLIKEYIDDLILWKNAQELLEAQNIVLAEKNYLSSDWKPFKSMGRLITSEALNLFALGTASYATIIGAGIALIESQTSYPSKDVLKFAGSFFFGGALVATISGLRYLCLAQEEKALEKYTIIKDVLNYLQTKKDAQMLDFAWKV